MFLEMSNEEYHARSEVSKSDLDLIAKAPYIYKNKKEYRKDSPYFALGSAFHSIVLEPEKFNSEFIITPKIDKRTKAGKEAYAEFEKEAQGKTIITSEDYDTIQMMRDKVMSNATANALLSNIIVEKSVTSIIEDVGVRCRFDAYNESFNTIIDLKSSISASPEEFAKSVANYRYHVQDSFYSDVMNNEGYKVDAFVFIVCNKSAPFEVGIYELDSYAKNKGRDLYLQDLETLKECRSSGIYPLYEQYDENGNMEPIRTISLPRWAQ